MRPHLVVAATFAALCAIGWLGLPASNARADAGGYKNLKVLPSTISKKDLKAVMKSQAKALGVDCDFCHDTDDFSADSETKKTARGMMQMTISVNKTYFGGKQMVTCATCHGGQKKPAALGPDADKK